MSKEMRLLLPRYSVMQILDGLRERARVWRYTEEYIETGYVHEPYCVEECSGAQEARQIAEHYTEIIESIERQLADSQEG